MSLTMIRVLRILKQPACVRWSGIKCSIMSKDRSDVRTRSQHFYVVFLEGKSKWNLMFIRNIDHRRFDLWCTGFSLSYTKVNVVLDVAEWRWIQRHQMQNRALKNVGVCTKINKLVSISKHGIYAHKTTEHMKLYIQLTYGHHLLARRSNVSKKTRILVLSIRQL